MKAFSCMLVNSAARNLRSLPKIVRCFSTAREDSDILNPQDVVLVGEDARFKNPATAYGRSVKRMLSSSQAMVAKEFSDLQHDDLFLKILVCKLSLTIESVKSEKLRNTHAWCRKLYLI